MADNRHAEEFDQIVADVRAAKLRIIQHAAAIALAFFKASFTNQGFTDESLVKWVNRVPGTPNNKGRAIEVNRGILKRALRIKKADKDGAIVGVDDGIPYAEIQNYGGKIPITPQMRRFFWAMYYKFGGGKGKSPTETAMFYRNLAITREMFITIPARKFIGESATLERKLREYITSELDRLFKTE